MNKFNILFLIHLPPPVHGASMMGKYIKESENINNKVNATYIDLATNKELAKSGKWGFKKIYIFCSLIKNIVMEVNAKKFDLCYMTLTSHGPAFYKDLILVFIMKKFKARVIFHFHNKGVRTSSGNRINRILYKYVFQDTKSILLSPYLYDDLQDYVKEKDIYYCANGIPEIIEKPFFRKENKVNFKFLYLSNMMLEKGIFVLLEAIKILKAKDLCFECHFVGGWGNLTEVEFHKQVSDLGVVDRTIVHGPKYGDQKLSFLRSSDVFVFPSLNECLPLVLLEALQYGLPVISTFEGAIPEIIEDGINGYLTPKKNAEALAEKMEKLILEPSLCIKMGNAGRKRYELLFTLKTFEHRLSEILQEVALKPVN